jgi:hypothetical protein
MNLDGYVPVTDRLKAALVEHPELRVVETGHEIVELAGDTVLICTVAVHRSPDDPLPTLGTASEPFPGRTPYTKGSELMVGYTSALGRALGYMGYGIDKALASADEVRAAEERRPTPPARVEVGSKARPKPAETWDDIPPPPDPDAPRPARRTAPTEKMIALYKKLSVERGWDINPEVLADFDACKAQIDHLIAHKD